METEATVLEMLGLITQSLSVGSVATGGQIVSDIPQLQTEHCISTQPIVTTTNDSPAIEKSDEHSLANIQQLVGSIEEIENEVGNSLHAHQTEDGIPNTLSDNKAVGDLLFQKQTLQTEQKTGNLVDEVAFISDSRLLTRTAGRRYEVLDEENLDGQDRTEGNVTSVTDNRATVCSQDSLAVGNNVVISNSHVQNTLPAFLSGQPESVDKFCTLPATNESTSELCVTNLNRSCEPSSMSTDINARAFQPTQVAHIAYCTSSSSNKHLHYAMRKHIMEELLINPYMCGICGDIFNSTLNLSEHVLSCHTLQMMQGSKIDGSTQGESNFDLPKRKEAREHLPIMSPKDEPQNGRNLDNMYLENLLQSSLGNEYKMSKDHGKNYESKVSTVKNEKITTTPDKDGGQKETKKLKLSTESDTVSMNMQRSDESFVDVISGVDLKDDCLDSVRNSGMESKVKEKEDKVLAKSKTKREKAFKCEFCEDLFTSNKYRYKHRVASHPEAVFQCPGCEKSYKVTEKDKWQHHIRTHNKPPKKPKLDSYSCSVCSVVFRAPNAVAIHMQTFHPEAVRGEKRFCCEICGNLFRTKSALKSHQSLVHSDEKPYQCETCEKGFKKESYLKLHRRTHTGEKPFTCKFCNKMFPSTTGRRSHERTHTNERPYKCTYCCSSFRAKPQLVEHERTHTQERPFVCPLCGKSFASRTSFKTHQFLHTGEKPYKCRSCTRSFAQKSNLTDHFRSIHSQEKPYECTVCSAKFTRSTSRKVHMEKKHGLAITVRQGRPPTHESNPTVDSIIATCLSIDVGSVLTPTEHQTLGDSFSVIVNNLTS